MLSGENSFIVLIVFAACRAAPEDCACHDVAALRRSRASALQAACKQAVPSQRCLLGLSEGSTLCFLTSSATLGARSLDEVVERADAQTTKKDTRMSILFCCTKRTGLEPATSAVTGLRSNQTELPLRVVCCTSLPGCESSIHGFEMHCKLFLKKSENLFHLGVNYELYAGDKTR